MGTIFRRQRKDGTSGYTCQIVRKKGGRRIHSEAQTFDTEDAARRWMVKRENEIDQPGGLEGVRARRATVGEAIERYVREARVPLGRSKSQALRSISALPIARMPCGVVTSRHLVEFAASFHDRSPATASIYMSYLGTVFEAAEAAWEYPLDLNEFRKARTVAKRLGYTGPSQHRTRRPTLDELDALMGFFIERSRRDPTCSPMHKIIAFAIFSTRRQDEICRIVASDLDRGGPRVMVRDMKHPGQKVGNDVWCDLPDPALGIIDAIPRKGEVLFPYKASAVSAAFTRACALLEIPDLHFHDLRHEGISRLFEMGWSMPQVQTVSGHRSWQSLQRYTQYREKGDKFAEWKWLPVACG